MFFSLYLPFGNFFELKMDLQQFDNVYFIGIGGIGMSALAQYFVHNGKYVSGYDRTDTEITQMLAKKGIEMIEMKNHTECMISKLDQKISKSP